MALAEAGEPEGTVVLAQAQQTGRGRRGHVWFSPPGAGLYLSAILRPRPHWNIAMTTLGAGVATAQAAAAVTGLPVELKWPNDVVIGRPWRKLGGILCEASRRDGHADALIIGIGVNVRHVTYPGALGRSATSLETELGRTVDRGLLVVEILTRLAALSSTLAAADGEAICRPWRELGRAGLAGASVVWRDASGDRQGRTRDIDVDGALVVEAAGRLERLVAGEVRWTRMSGE
jgi:BirA family biotin operon repressor/biotin-[acetyl-CoA-carboxylase] ligase